MRWNATRDALADAMRKFRRREGGVITAFSLFMLIALMMIAGIALDVANMMSHRTHLQVAADASAHAALLTRETRSESEARDVAIQLSRQNLPGERFGEVLTPGDIEFGRWNFETRTFTPDTHPVQAVRVHTRRIEGRSNAVPTFLLKLVGLEQWNLVTPSVFAGYLHPCLREGLVAEERVRVRSNNTFGNGFCVHSNSYVEFNNHNTFESGTVVSMPDLEMLGLPGSGFKHNDGLEAALREGSMDIRILNRIDTIIAGLRSGDPAYLPDYIVSTLPVALESMTISDGDLEPGYIYTADCHGSGTISISSGTVLSNVVIATDCDISFGSNAEIHDVVIATSSTATQSVHAAADVSIGREDNCAEGGDAQVLTLGGMHFAAKLGVNGGQLVARGDINFAAQGAAVEGGSMVAGGEIDGTSNLEFAYCGTGMGNAYTAEVFRLVN
ncbi:pilus assembly protein TadG-related protein [Alkalilacustris brevis]|uniref:pilus assembly protein TadG-related protein n=1 Tax=Alkalilacustris brevis TaxID=2026338 RepID=UPI000E0CFCFE|nr:pilus assembly protein TadG-related protein [Alkalilacustris brevis]